MKKRISILFFVVLTLVLAFTSCDVANKKVDSMQVLSGAPTEVVVDDTPDFSELKVKVTYNDGDVKEVGYSDVTVSAIDTSTLGKKEYTITYDGYSITMTINVKSASSVIQTVTLDSISYLSGIKTEFYEGADFHLTDLKVTANYSDGSTKTVTADKLTVVQNVDGDVVGEHTLIVAYEGKQLEIKIKVLKIEPSYISLVLNDFKSSVLIGRSFDTSLITGTLHYNNSTTKPIANADISFAAVDTATAGHKKLVGTYQGMTAECNVEVLGIKSIEFSGFKTKIKFNEELDLSALKATVIATDNKNYEISASEITVDKDNLDLTLTDRNSKVTTIAFDYCGSKKEYNIEVYAEESDAKLLNIELLPSVELKTSLFVGEAFDDSEIKAKATYSFGYTKTLTKDQLTVSGEVGNEAKTYDITYSFGEKSFTVSVTVVEPTPTDIKLNLSNLGWVVKGEKLDTSSITATLSYNSGKTEQLANSNLTISTPDTSAAGKLELTVSYAGIEKKVAYEVVEAVEIKTVEGIKSSVSLGGAAYEEGKVEAEILLSNGETIDRPVTVDTSKYDSNKAGTTTLTVKFDAVTKDITVTVVEKLEELVLESIAIQANTLKSSIFAGESYDYSGIAITATFNYGVTKTYTLNTGVSVTTTGSTTVAGSYVIVASYTHGEVTKTAEFSVTVKEPTPTDLQLNLGDLGWVVKGEALDTSSITATLLYDYAGKTDTLANSDLTISTPDTSAAGKLELTVSYAGIEKKVAYEVVEAVEIKDVHGIETTVSLGNAAYEEGKVEAEILLSNGETIDRPVTVDTSKYDSTKTGTTTLTVEFGGVTKDITVTVEEVTEELVLEGIAIQSNTLKPSIFAGESYDYSGIKIIATFNYGITKTFTINTGVSVTTTGSTSEAGSYVLTASYTHGDVTKTAEFTVEVKPLVAQRLEITGSCANSILIGDFLYMADITAKLYYNSGKFVALQNTELSFDVDVSRVGETTLTVSHAETGLSDTKTVTVVGVEEIEKIEGVNDSYRLNSQVDTKAIRLTIIGTDGQRYFRGYSAKNVTVPTLSLDDTKQSETKEYVFTYCKAEFKKNITVYAEFEDASLKDIAIIPASLKSSIFAGDTYDYSNIRISAAFTYGFTKNYAQAHGVSVTTEGSTEAAGEYKIIASYEHNGVTKTAEFTVEVKAVVATELEITGTYSSSILLGDAFDTSKITAILHYNNGSEKALTNGELEFSIDISEVGERTLTVSNSDTGLDSTAAVTVIGIKNVAIVGGVNDRYRVNNAINSENIELRITGTDDKTYTRYYSDKNVTIPTLSLDQTKPSETKQYVFTYCGFEFTKDITVYAEFEDSILLRIEYNGKNTILRKDDFASHLSVNAIYTYGYSKTYTEGVTYTGDIDTSVVGNYDVTVSYGGKSVNATIEVVYPKVTNITIHYAPYGILGEDYDYDSISVTVQLENNEVLTESLCDLSVYNISAVIDINTAGEKTLTLSANGKNYTKAVTVYKIEEIKINTDNFSNVVKLDGTFSTDSLGEIIVKLEGLQEPAIREADSFADDVNTSVAGNYTLTATYLGVTSLPVRVTVAARNFQITAVDEPQRIAEWKENKYSEKFLDSGYQYFVGDDNPFRYQLNFSLYDDINDDYEAVNLEYVSASKVTLNGVEVGADYVIIDEINHTFDFTEAAIGKTFVITTAHEDFPEESASLEILVVDGYNIYDAIELNLFTNRNANIGSSGKHQLDVLYPFLASNKVAGIDNMSKEQYIAFVNSINGIIIHDNLTIEHSDLPEDYFFITPDRTKYIWDHQAIYFRQFTEVKLDDPSTTTPEIFNVYGNYFTIISNNVPIVATEGLINKNGVASNDDDELSSSQLFYFDVSSDIENQAIANNKFYAENYQMNIYALGMHDNDPSVAIQEDLARQRSKLGVIGIKFRHAVYNLNAVNAERYFITTFPDNDDLVVNYDYCTFYDAWSNHIMTWALNSLDITGGDKFDGSVHVGYKPITLNITNSFMGRCGGPVIIAVNKDPGAEYNTKAGSKTITTIDDKTNIFSYVVGDESWFKAYSADGIMSDIVIMNNFFKLNGSSFETTIKGKAYVNMILLNMEAGFIPGSTDAGSTDLDGYISIAGQKKLDMDDSNNYSYGHYGVVDGVHAGAMALGSPVMPPVFVSEIGGASYFDGALNIVSLPGYTQDQSKYAAMSGNHLSLYYFNLGVLLGFNEPVLEKEQNPESFFESIDWKITDRHGIN